MKPSKSLQMQKRTEILYESILKSAVLLYKEIGFDSATTNKIAARAGVGIGSLYRYFPDKSAILKALTREFVKTNRAIFCETFKNTKGQELEPSVAFLVSGAIDHFLSHSPMFVTFLVKAYETGMQDRIFECRHILSQDFSAQLLDRYPEQVTTPKEQLELRLYLAFHAFMSQLLAYMQLPKQHQDLDALKRQLTRLLLIAILPD